MPNLKSIITLGWLILLLIIFFLSTSQATIHNISIIDFQFVPQVDTAVAGDTVRWTNNGSFPHTSTSDSSGWNSGTLNSGQSFSFEFLSTGSYPYHCAIHTSMTGIIVILSNTCGDTNGDGQVSVSDVVFLISYLFRGGPAPYPSQNADANGDSQVTLSDVVYLISYLFKSGNPPIC